MKAIQSVCSRDAHAFKAALPAYIPPDDKTKANFVIPDMSNKAAWGWNDDVTACFLCPMQHVSKFNKDPQ